MSTTRAALFMLLVLDLVYSGRTTLNHSSGAISLARLCFFFSPFSNPERLAVTSHLSDTAAERTGPRKLQGGTIS
jgi:hypothetical protein